MDWIQSLDYTGTAVFAISGALAGLQKRFDPFGILVLGLVTAVGGGTLRDMMIGRTPVGWMQDINYLYIILGSTIIAILFQNWLGYLRKTLFLFDAIGLGLFTVLGVEIGLQFKLHPAICVLLGTSSAVFGGVIRDVLAREVPLIFHKEVYASISIIGGIIFLLLQWIDFPSGWSYVLVVIWVVVLRILAVRKKWSLQLPVDDVQN